ncbi:MAG: pantetheine-phosphate adenylyltransferase [Firmicutes bacterium HGW-Firmicutes-11]|jgi:pantetheine-phosphate adenylyltransferase|nr:MAG: pantetheine-phosphate adenylyltransferase [Firmicutes bacterium HGW-Firmicutes-11]
MKRVLYAGTFDPITNGHLDLINRASKLCDCLMIGVMENKSKKPFFSTEERSEMIKKCTTHLKNAEVISFDGLLAEYVNCNHIEAVIRGLRATMDFEFEMQMAQMNARLYNKDVETIFLMTTPQFSFISSSIVKEVFALDGDVSGLVPDVVLEELKRAFHK